MSAPSALSLPEPSASRRPTASDPRLRLAWPRRPGGHARTCLQLAAPRGEEPHSRGSLWAPSWSRPQTAPSHALHVCCSAAVTPSGPVTDGPGEEAGLPAANALSGAGPRSCPLPLVSPSPGRALLRRGVDTLSLHLHDSLSPDARKSLLMMRLGKGGFQGRRAEPGFPGRGSRPL